MNGEGPIVSLDALLAGGARFEWYEALGIVQGICAAATSAAAVAIPALDQVYIHSSGRVVTPEFSSSRASVVAIAEVFSRLLPALHRTTTFQSVIAEATGDESRYATPLALSAALQPFERPDRDAIVRTAYERLRGSAQVSGPVVRDAMDAFPRESDMPSQKLPAVETPAPAKRPARRRFALSRREAGALAAVATALVCLAIVVFVMKPATPQTTAVPVDEPTEVRPAADQTNPLPAASGVAPDATRSKSASIPAAQRPLVEDGQQSSDVPDSIRIPSAEDTPQAAPPVDQHAASPAIVADDGQRTFAANDRDVVPPIAQYAQELWHSPASENRNDLVEVEIVVNETGAVESVKALDDPTTVAEAMIVNMSLSAAKSWHFQPALKDGRPVKYRQRVLVTLRGR